MNPEHVVLVGLMGTGKTTVGKKVAREIGHVFYDSDAEIEAGERSTVREIFDSKGEETFREIESGVLIRLLASKEPIVLATGGGVVLAETNRHLLAGARHVVWLRATVETLESRLRSTKGVTRRPLLDGDLHDRLVVLDRDRGDLYREVATVTIDVDGLDSDQVSKFVVDAVRKVG